jgi:hypothetical protein
MIFKSNITEGAREVNSKEKHVTVQISVSIAPIQ